MKTKTITWNTINNIKRSNFDFVSCMSYRQYGQYYIGYERDESKSIFKRDNYFVITVINSLRYV